MDSHTAFALEIKRNVTVMENILGEKFLYYVLFIATADYELVMSPIRVYLHYVP